MWIVATMTGVFGKEGMMMKRKRRMAGLLLLCVLSMSLVACSQIGGSSTSSDKEGVSNGQQDKGAKDSDLKKDNTEDSSTKDGSANTGDIEVNNSNMTEEEMYQALFDINNAISIQLEISQTELDKLQEDYIRYDTRNSKSPIYRMADKVIITIDDEVFEIEEVGIRLKGNTSRVPVYDKKTGQPNLSHYKLSFHETFDDEEYYGEDAKVWESEAERQERKDRRFATLKELEIKWNKNFDDTHIREYYANSIFRKAGVLAQQLNLCCLGVNGDNYGVVNIYDPVEKIFIERNLPKEDWGGDLYKCGWTFKPANYVEGSVTYGIQDKDENKFYNYSLKTNKNDSTHAQLIHLLEVLNKKKVSKEDFEGVIDADYLTKFLAASYFMGDPDDLRNNYNNHYVYFLKSSGKAIFIPYDNDRCLGLTHSWNPDQTGMTEVSPYSDRAEGNNSKQKNPVIIYSVLEDGYYVNEYTEELKKIAEFEDWKEDNFEQVYEIAKENYEQVVVPAVKFENMDGEFKFSLEGEFTNGDETNMSFQEYVQRLMDTFNESLHSS